MRRPSRTPCVFTLLLPSFLYSATWCFRNRPSGPASLFLISSQETGHLASQFLRSNKKLSLRTPRYALSNAYTRCVTSYMIWLLSGRFFAPARHCARNCAWRLASKSCRCRAGRRLASRDFHIVVTRAQGEACPNQRCYSLTKHHWTCCANPNLSTL